MRYKVPQNVQREDRIFLFITLRQLIILMVGFGVSYLMFIGTGKSYDLSIFQVILIFIPAAISAIIAFVKIAGVSIFEFILLLLEQLIFRARKRYWAAGGGDPFVSMTFVIKEKKAAKTPLKTHEKTSSKTIKDLANAVDIHRSSAPK